MTKNRFYITCSPLKLNPARDERPAFVCLAIAFAYFMIGIRDVFNDSFKKLRDSCILSKKNVLHSLLLSYQFIT